VMKFFSCLVFFALLALAACSDRTELVGRYEASHSGLSGEVDVVMILGEDGTGKWEIEGEVLSFSWTVRSEGILVHTRDGAVVEGMVEGEDVRLDVPGIGKLLFVRGK
jgi:hypothetical protein